MSSSSSVGPHVLGLLTFISSIVAVAGPNYTWGPNGEIVIRIWNTSNGVVQTFILFSVFSSLAALVGCILARPGNVAKAPLLAKLGFTLTALFSAIGWIDYAATFAGTGLFGASFAFMIITMLLAFIGLFVSLGLEVEDDTVPIQFKQESPARPDMQMV